MGAITKTVAYRDGGIFHASPRPFLRVVVIAVMTLTMA
jgi:hypothetical protein